MSDQGGHSGGIIIDECVLFRTNEKAYKQVKRQLLNEFNAWTTIGLPVGVCVSAGAGMKIRWSSSQKGNQQKAFDITIFQILRSLSANRSRAKCC